MGKIYKEIQRLSMTKRLNILIGSGVSMPGISLMGNVAAENEMERNQILIDEIKNVSRYLLEENSIEHLDDGKIKDIKTTLDGYKGLIHALISILNKANSRQVPKNVNIFTTNYDLFLEKAIDEVLKDYPLMFNDGASGYFNRYLSSSNYNKTVSYKGINDNYINEVPSITLIKPHGSVNWEEVKNKILIKNAVVNEPVVVEPDGKEEQNTFLNNHFHEMLRVFQLELDKPQSILITIGFSFQDKHIAKMIKRAIQNPELMIFMFGYVNSEFNDFKKNLGIESKLPPNIKIITPENLPEALKYKNEKSETFNVFNMAKLLCKS